VGNPNADLALSFGDDLVRPLGIPLARGGQCNLSPAKIDIDTGTAVLSRAIHRVRVLALR
jgi:hypothetical protein